MVKFITQAESRLISQAIKDAESRTCAEIVTVVVPSSDHYHEHLMLCGFFIGGLIDIILWGEKIVTHFPWLLFIQIAAAILFPIIPKMLSFCLPLMPRQMYHHRAAQAAGEEFLAILKQVPFTTPVLLIFISLAERYVHIFPNKVVSEKIPPEKWDVVAKQLAETIAKSGLTSACISAINEVGGLLAPAFFSREDIPHVVSTDVITRIED